MHSDRPKQFIEIAGRPVIAYTLQAFEKHARIDRIYVVCGPEWAEYVEQNAKECGITKFCSTFTAGQTSMDSLRNGLRGIRECVADANPAIITHEAVRPLVSEEIITRNLDVLEKHGCAITAIRSNEAYMVSEDGLSSDQSIAREALFRAQTPQSFYLKDLEQAFHRAGELGIHTSQSLYTLMAQVYPRLYIAAGNELNFKLTLPQDIETLKALLAYRRS